VGGSGTLGRHVVEELRSRGHDVRPLSRRSTTHPVDLRTGAGLPDALSGCEIVIDASNDNSKHAAETLVGGSRRLLAAEQALGVRHHICVSIVGCDQVPLGYFRIKVDQERVVQQGPMPWTIVRATQFHELVAATFSAAARWGLVPVPSARLQTIASAEVARAIADIAQGPPERRHVRVAGPEIVDARVLALTWRSIMGAHTLILPVPLPGRLGRALREGALTVEEPDRRGTTSFAAWLSMVQRKDNGAA
jgi:uncharacterized protein YbjT (DUF2867 family)